MENLKYNKSEIVGNQKRQEIRKNRILGKSKKWAKVRNQKK